MVGSQLGLIGDGIRLPLTPLSTKYHAEVGAAMTRAGVA
jgi:4-hydroxy-tetrahydrodipicolinate synthase